MTATEEAWFRKAVDAPVRARTVEVDGAQIAYRQWGALQPTGVVLVHGGAAHSRWWDHIGPMLADDCSVVALDLSGHGDSSRRGRYSLATWAREVLAVASGAGLQRPIVVGHSMGGWVSITAGANHSDDLTGIIVIDSPIRDFSPEELAAREQRAFGPLRAYPDRELALARFRTIPDQPDALPFVLSHIAETSLRQSDDGGWTWKFDPQVFGHLRPSEKILASVSCRVAVLRGENGLVTSDIGQLMYDLLGRVAPIIEIPLAGHHIMLDQPLPLISSLRTLLADWDHSLPRRRGTSPGQPG